MEQSFESAGDEGRRLLSVFARGLPMHIDARNAITAMRDGGSSQWRQMEWIGFYPEFFFESTLADGLQARRGPAFGKVSFDIQRHHVWDLKAHSSDSPEWAPLNDEEAVASCIEHHNGLGFVVLSGPCEYDEDGSFKQWHESLKGGKSAYSAKREKEGAKSRRRKTAFKPNHILVFRFETLSDLERAKSEGWVKRFQTGMRNSNDVPRRPKIQVNLKRVAPWSLVGEIHR